MKRISLVLGGLLLSGSALAGAPGYEEAARMQRGADFGLNQFGTPYPAEFEDAYMGGASLGEIDLIEETALFSIQDPNLYQLDDSDLYELELERREMRAESQELAALGYGLGTEAELASIDRAISIRPVDFDRWDNQYRVQRVSFEPGMATTQVRRTGGVYEDITGQRQYEVTRVEYEPDGDIDVEREIEPDLDEALGLGAMDDESVKNRFELALEQGADPVEVQLQNAGFTITDVEHGVTERAAAVVRDPSMARNVQLESVEIDDGALKYHFEVEEGGTEYDITAYRPLQSETASLGTRGIQQVSTEQRIQQVSHDPMHREARVIQGREIRPVSVERTGTGMGGTHIEREMDALELELNGTLSHGVVGGWDIRPEYRILSQTPQRSEILVTLNTSAAQGATPLAEPERFEVDLEIPELRNYQGEVIVIVQDESGNEIDRLMFR